MVHLGDMRYLESLLQLPAVTGRLDASVQSAAAAAVNLRMAAQLQQCSVKLRSALGSVLKRSIERSDKQ
jgi:hypothetical protein